MAVVMYGKNLSQTDFIEPFERAENGEPNGMMIIYLFS